MTVPRHPQDEPPELTEHDGYPIYPMPVFASVSASDPIETVRWFTEILDFGVVFTGPEVGGVHVLTHLRRGRYQDVLVAPATEPVVAGNGLTFTVQLGDADTVDEVARRAVAAGGEVDGPVDTPWNTRDFGIVDPDGNRYVFTGRGRVESEELADMMQSTADPG